MLKVIDWITIMAKLVMFCLVMGIMILVYKLSGGDQWSE